MKITVEYMLEKLRYIPERVENEEAIRNLACDILASADENERYFALCECRRKIRKIQNEKCRTAHDGDMQSLDIGKLIENLTLCAGVLVSQESKKFSCDLERQTVACCPSLIIDAFMNLLSNSVKYSSTNDISVSLFSKGENEFIIIENAGHINFGDLSSKGGIDAAAKCARLHSGRLLYSSSGGRVKAAMSISRTMKGGRQFSVPDYSSYLTDEFSPVYIGLADI